MPIMPMPPPIMPPIMPMPPPIMPPRMPIMPPRMPMPPPIMPMPPPIMLPRPPMPPPMPPLAKPPVESVMALCIAGIIGRGGMAPRNWPLDRLGRSRKARNRDRART